MVLRTPVLPSLTEEERKRVSEHIKQAEPSYESVITAETKSRPLTSPLGRARRGAAGPADLGFGLAAPAWRATRHRRAGQPDRGVGVRRADQRRILVEGPWTFFFDD